MRFEEKYLKVICQLFIWLLGSSDKSSQNYISDSEFAEIVCKILNETNVSRYIFIK